MHVGNKLTLMSNEEGLDFLGQDINKEAGQKLFVAEDGTDRFYLVEDRSSKINIIQDLIEQLIIGCNCKVIIIDPLQDLFAGLSNEQQEEHMAWQKILIKLYGVCLINVNHTRKASSSKEAASLGNMIAEEDIQGSSTVYKSAKINILLQRNKMAEDELEKNTTYAWISKNRDTGMTGLADKIIYDNQTHTLYSEEDYRSLFPEKFVEELPEDANYL